MSLKLLFFLIWLLIVAFLVWYFFIKNKSDSNKGKTKSEKGTSNLKDKFLTILIEIIKIPNLSSKDRKKIYDELEKIADILEKIEGTDIPPVKRYEIEKLIGDYLYRLVLSLNNSEQKNVEKFLEGIDIIKTQLEKIYNDYIQNSLDLDKEIEFLKRKFKSI
ncbi:MAG: hypothetical protein DSY59_00475 [Persephonella sp.]|nr:MAG: hypothetical protein DSY59_00475 [Persephonella sp.]